MRTVGLVLTAWLPLALPTLSGILALGTQAGLSRTAVLCRVGEERDEAGEAGEG